MRAHTRGRGHATPENFELFMLRNAFSSVLRGQFLSKCQLNRHLFMLIFNCVASHTSTRFQFPFKYILLEKYQSQSQSQIHIFHFLHYFKRLLQKLQ